MAISTPAVGDVELVVVNRATVRLTVSAVAEPRGNHRFSIE